MLVAGAAGVGLARTAPAALNVTLEAAAIQGSALTTIVPLTNGKSVVAGAVGDTIVFRLWGTISAGDANAANDGILAVAGSFKSNTGTGSSAASGGVKGNLSSFRTPNTATNTNGVQGVAGMGFTGTGGSQGVAADLDNDGDLDVGSDNPNDASATFFADRANVAPFPNFAGNNPDAGNTNPFAPRILLGTLKMVITSITGADATVNFFKREVNSGGASWFEDAVTQFDSDSNVTGYSNAVNYDPANPSTWTVGANVVITGVGGAVPEPTTLGFASLAGLGLLARRRK